jgi:hypothetical protein
MQLQQTLLMYQPRKEKLTFFEHKIVAAKMFLAFSVELQNSFVSPS